MSEHHDKTDHAATENNESRLDRRRFLRAGAVGAVGAAAAVGLGAAKAVAATADNPYADPANPALPPSDMKIDFERVALVITDPQVDFLSPKGVTWGVVGENVTELDTVKNIGRLFVAAKQAGITVAVSPHYYFPTDKGWQFEGALEVLMHNLGMFDRPGPLSLEGFEGSGADWLARYKPYIEDGQTVVVSPHKVYGPQNNDLILQLRKRGIDRVILAGMSANLCVESHLRDMLEQGFEVAVVKDATAAAQVPDGDGYAAALVNFRFIANAVWTTDEFKRMLGGEETEE